MIAPPPVEPRRRIGRINRLGLWTHYSKEVQRFWKVGFQTLVAPMVTTLLFLAVFTLALGRAVESIRGVPFEVFLAPGLIMFAIIQNSFANTSSSMLILKIQGSIVDLLLPPLTAAELTVGFIGGSVTRGVAVGTLVGSVMYVFTDIIIMHPWIVLFYGVSASVMLSLLGLITAIWADKFDNIASITNFVIVPLSFLSGTFYSIDRLPEFWHQIAALNPFFYLIDGFRSGFIGSSDAPVLIGIIVITALNAVLWVTCHTMFARGYKLKS
jgi:ABC-2 type transport system permease protein